MPLSPGRGASLTTRTVQGVPPQQERECPSKQRSLAVFFESWRIKVDTTRPTAQYGRELPRPAPIAQHPLFFSSDSLQRAACGSSLSHGVGEEENEAARSWAPLHLRPVRERAPSCATARRGLRPTAHGPGYWPQEDMAVGNDGRVWGRSGSKRVHPCTQQSHEKQKKQVLRPISPSQAHCSSRTFPLSPRRPHGPTQPYRGLLKRYPAHRLRDHTPA